MKQILFQHKADIPRLPGFSIVIPSYMRTDLLRKSLESIAASKGLNQEFRIALYIVDGTPKDHEHKKEILGIVDEFSQNKQFSIFLLQEKNQPSITNAKIEGAKFCRDDGNGMLIFTDTDIFLQEDTLINCLAVLKRNNFAAWVGRRSIWRGDGPLDGKLWKPDPLLEICTPDGRKMEYDEYGRTGSDELLLISAIHGDFICMYKEVYFTIGGYDILFAHHGENVDLSIKCWRHGFPLVYDDRVVVYHSIKAPYSITRKNKTSKQNRESIILSTPLKMGYIYSIMNNPDELEKFHSILDRKWVQKILRDQTVEQVPGRIIYLFLQNIDKMFADFDLLKDSRNRTQNTPFSRFMPYDIFKDKSLFRRCLDEAPKRLAEIRDKALHEGNNTSHKDML